MEYIKLVLMVMILFGALYLLWKLHGFYYYRIDL